MKQFDIPKSLSSFATGAVNNIVAWIKQHYGIPAEEAEETVGRWLLTLAAKHGVLAVPVSEIEIGLEQLPKFAGDQDITLVTKFSKTLIQIAKEDLQWNQSQSKSPSNG